MDFIFTSRQIMEKFNEYNKDPHVLFVGFKQACDSIDCVQLWTALRNFGVPEKHVKLIEMYNQKTYCKVHFVRETSEVF